MPLHLLQVRIRNPVESQAHAAAHLDGYKPPPPFEPLTHETLKCHVGIVQNFFLAKLHSGVGINDQGALVEDEDLPIKQRAPKPRLPTTGKISVPRKRPLQQQGGGSKKKKKPNTTEEKGKKGGDKVIKGGEGLMRTMSKMSDVDGGEGVGEGGMISPESIVAGA